MKNKTHKILKRRKSRYSDQDFSYAEKAYSREIVMRQGSVFLTAYKGTILITSDDEAPTIKCAWLRGEDFDRLIEELREARAEWKRTYLRTNKVIAASKVAIAKLNRERRGLQ